MNLHELAAEGAAKQAQSEAEAFEKEMYRVVCTPHCDDLRIEQIAAHYGFTSQADMLCEEAAEFMVALSKLRRGKADAYENIKEEVADAYLSSVGAETGCRVEWDNINLQDETALAEARLKNAQAREIELRELIAGSGEVIAGLKRLAFGSCRDAVVLAFAEELPPAEVIGKLDLFNVSEIKRVKGGGVEVKLFDRLKALEKLFELENTFSDRDKAAGLIRALSSKDEEVDEPEDN